MMPVTILAAQTVDVERQGDWIVVAISDRGNNYWIHFDKDQASMVAGWLNHQLENYDDLMEDDDE